MNNNAIIYDDEYDLQRKIAGKLNKFGFNFEQTKGGEFCDLIDKVKNIYVEVKLDEFAPSQLLYGIAKEKISDVSYIGLANSYEIRFYKPPNIQSIDKFARKIDPTLEIPPSKARKKLFDDEGFKLLGNHYSIYTYNGELDLENPKKHLFITPNNYYYFKIIFDKYLINPARFLPYIANLYANNSEIKVNNQGYLIDINNGKFYINDDERKVRRKGKILPSFSPDYRPIRNIHDKQLIESSRIKRDDVTGVLHEIDKLTPTKIRRQKGKYFTQEDVGIITSRYIMEYVDPDFILEPYVGGGSLIEPFLLYNIEMTVNDISKGHIDLLHKKLAGNKITFFARDFILTPINEIIDEWSIPKSAKKPILVYSNPPFGTSATNWLAMKKNEKQSISRKIKIDYGGLDELYGKGDLVIPAIAKMIETIKTLGKGYLAFFSPFGIFCGRLRYNKLLTQILKNFEFLYGEVFSGDKFHDVSKKKPISFTIWKYTPNINTDHESLNFIFEGESVNFKRMVLLNEGWRYDTRKYVHGEITVQGNDRFNVAAPKMIHLKIDKGGSELIPENIKIELKIPNLPSELLYGLWSCAIGHRSLTDHPVIIDNAYVHLPEFAEIKVQEILTYTAISMLIAELLNNYTGDKMGFIGMGRKFTFGNEKLTQGVEYLINTYKDSSLGNSTIETIFELLKSTPNPEDIDKTIRQDIRDEIEKRLEEIGYYDFIPIPRQLKTSKKKKPLTEF
ncbi:MAG: hypothetical protein HeimC3_34260 [Candidatus Heimdallarchaeota archaeon LC_3]|nr:MAG: hypothetical protein HeimC3_34260 [Candidatus Heimdallarchaeota archaeon LC_3]